MNYHVIAFILVAGHSTSKIKTLKKKKNVTSMGTTMDRSPRNTVKWEKEQVEKNVQTMI